MASQASSSQATSGGLVVIACGALAREILELQRLNHWQFDLTCVPAAIHNSPQEIPEAVEKKILEAQLKKQKIFVAFADCGTGGQLDAVLEKYKVARLPGAHCYEFYATSGVFAAMMDEEIGTFFLTDFLARHFEALVIRGLGIDQHPELMPVYFSHYKKLVYLAQSYDEELLCRAKKAAQTLGLEFEQRYTGFGNLEHSLNVFASASSANVNSQKNLKDANYG